jgi:SPP1 family predicted phage head-tail adaptor
MSIGETKQIRLEQWQTSKDAKGNNIETIIKKINTWAEVSKEGGDRSSLNGLTQLTNTYRFRTRFASIDVIDLTGNWRIVYDRRYFKVHNVEKEKQNRFYYIIKAEASGKR